VVDCLQVRGDARDWTVRLTATADTRLAGWGSSGAEVIIEATGTEANQKGCRDYLDPSVRWAVITHTSPHADATIVAGVNEDRFDLAKTQVISTSICDACALAPIFRVLADRFGVEHAFLTTLHPGSGTRIWARPVGPGPTTVFPDCAWPRPRGS
jgi:glyceraldehyde 3-phosphate dehydrogenase